MKMVEPSPQALGLLESLRMTLAMHAGMDPMEQLVTLCQVVGGMVAIQDSRIPVTQIMEVVGKNIEIGNQIALRGVLDGGRPS